ncbi:MAG: hypothetical protein Fur0025_22270 [Oscillatoriaceae cyanobacterium]
MAKAQLRTCEVQWPSSNVFIGVRWFFAHSPQFHAWSDNGVRFDCGNWYAVSHGEGTTL